MKGGAHQIGLAQLAVMEQCSKECRELAPD